MTRRSALTIFSIVIRLELAVSVIYAPSPLGGDGISIDVGYIPSRLPALRGQR